MFCSNSPPWPNHLGWLCMAWLIASLSYTRLWPMWSFWLAFCDCGFSSRGYGIIVFASSYSSCLCPVMDKDKRSVQHKKGNIKECSKYWTIALISHASKVILKILHARLQHYSNQELPDHFTCLLRNLYGSQEVTEPCMEQLIGSGLRKEYDRAVCCHPVSLTYMLSTLWEILDWMSYNLESR